MALFTNQQRSFADAVSRLTFCNPFMPTRIELERQALGDAFVDAPLVWSLQPRDDDDRPNLVRLVEQVGPRVETLREHLQSKDAVSPDDLALYEDLAVFVLYHRYREDFHKTIASATDGAEKTVRVPYWRKFEADFNHLVRLPGRKMRSGYEAAHLFACFFQIRRAFNLIFRGIVGGSMPAAKLRATVWQSIFTEDLRRYARVLYRHMGDMTTLVSGPSGTGKELVAQSIGQSRYIPFNVETLRFTEDAASSFFPLNLSALSPTLIESELFGHQRGSFTGAIRDRAGWMDVCPPLGTIFLDEIGELDPAIQVKLLRILQTRTFQRLGDTKDRRFHGKIIAATNRDLAAELEAGRFRRDFYYRLCSDIVTTPSLREQLADYPDDLHTLVLYIARGIVGEEADAVAGEVVPWVQRHLGLDYPWPGNFRELEVCVRNIVIRGSYMPLRAQPRNERDRLLDDVRAGRVTADQLLRRYCTMVYAECGSYEEAARRLDLDRRTVKARVDVALLERLRGPY